MSAASGIQKQVKYKAESAFNTVPAAASAQLLRRVSSGLDMTKDTYQSNEIRPDYQLADFRHGMRKVTGAIAGELSPKTFADFFAAALKRDFTAGVAPSGLSITVAGTAGAWTLTRATGSWITDGVKQGDVIALTAGTFNAANLNKNILIYTVTATVLTGIVLNGTALVAEGPIASATLTVRGKKTYTPTSSLVDRSFSIEHWFPDVPNSEVYSGCKVTKASIALPPTGIATVNWDFIGAGVTPATVEYFTSPNAITTTGALAAVNGVLRFGNSTVADITGLSIDISCDQDAQATVGSNTYAAFIAKRLIVTGQVTALFDTTTFRDSFLNESEIALFGAFTCDNTALSSFLSFNIPRLKLTSGERDDGEKTIIATYGFQALFNTNGATTNSDLSTLIVQDSDA